MYVCKWDLVFPSHIRVLYFNLNDILIYTGSTVLLIWTTHNPLHRIQPNKWARFLFFLIVYPSTFALMGNRSHFLSLMQTHKETICGKPSAFVRVTKQHWEAVILYLSSCHSFSLSLNYLKDFCNILSKQNLSSLINKQAFWQLYSG